MTGPPNVSFVERFECIGVLYCAGTSDLLPVLLCGDFNSVPNSPLLHFLTKSNLNYSDLSAVGVAGYFEGGLKSRAIPTPLLPQEMCIGQDSMYRRQGGGGGGGGGGERSRQGGGRVDKEGEKHGETASKRSLENLPTQGNQVLGNSCIESGGGVGVATTDQSKKPTGKDLNDVGFKSSVNQVTGQSEFTATDMEIGSEDVRSTRSTRSIRGARSRGGSSGGRGANFSEGRSLLGSSSTTKRGRGLEPPPSSSDYLSIDDVKSTPGPSDASSLDDFVVDPPPASACGGGAVSAEPSGCGSRPTENGNCDSLESSMSSVTGNRMDTSRGKPGKAGQRTNSQRKPRVGTVEKPKLTHPFKLMSSYPISKSCPSIITTYHQCAFEAVDYIFFSPIACSTDGAEKRLTGFNLLKRKVLPSTHTLLDLGPQPHQFLSSDHLLLQATFQFSW